MPRSSLPYPSLPWLRTRRRLLAALRSSSRASSTASTTRCSLPTFPSISWHLLLPRHRRRRRSPSLGHLWRGELGPKPGARRPTQGVHTRHSRLSTAAAGVISSGQRSTAGALRTRCSRASPSGSSTGTYSTRRCTSRRVAGGGALSVAPTLDLALSRWWCSSSSSCTSGSSRSSGSSSAHRSSCSNCSSSTASGGGGGRARRRS